MKRAIILIGVVLALAGLTALLHPDFTYHEKKQVAQIGPMKATVDEEKTATVPMGVSVLLIVAGGGLALFGSHKRKPSAV
jgi:hypothetical protein